MIETKAMTITDRYSGLMAPDTGFSEDDLDDGMHDEVNVRNLPTAKLGQGGATVWMLKNAADTAVNELRGVVMARREVRVMFPGKMGQGGSNIPICTSEDGIIGEPRDAGWERGATGDCLSCPMARPFSSGTQWAPACSLRSHVYAMVEGYRSPVLFDLPPSSHSVVRDYFVALKMGRLPIWAVETVFRVGQRTGNNGKITYSVAKLERGEEVPDGMIEKMREQSRKWREMLIPSPLAQPPQRPANIAEAGLEVREGRVVDVETGEIIEQYDPNADDLPFEGGEEE